MSKNVHTCEDSPLVEVPTVAHSESYVPQVKSPGLLHTRPIPLFSRIAIVYGGVAIHLLDLARLSPMKLSDNCEAVTSTVQFYKNFSSGT